MARINPYTRLQRIAMEWASSVLYPHTQTMWTYPKERLDGLWRLTNLNERVEAAEQLGYRVIIESNEQGLVVKYEKKPSELPWELR